jgi:hypothetical protein
LAIAGAASAAKTVARNLRHFRIARGMCGAAHPNLVAEVRGVPSGQGSYKVVSGKAGHYPFPEHADKFNSQVLEFLKSRRDRAPPLTSFAT